MKLYLTFFFVLSTFSSANKDIQRRVISDNEFNYTFYILSTDTSSNNVAKNYHWYKSGEIHISQGSSSGSLLHGEYTKSYIGYNLAEQGYFKKGLKNNTWKKWRKNGQLYEISNWKNGHRSGRYAQFTEDGKISIQGAYKNKRKHGVWINTATRDTLYFKKGIAIEKAKKHSRKTIMQKMKTFSKGLFAKKEKDGLKKDSKSKKFEDSNNKKRKEKGQKKNGKKQKNGNKQK